jgi:hypothetical protein
LGKIGCEDYWFKNRHFCLGKVSRVVVRVNTLLVFKTLELTNVYREHYIPENFWVDQAFLWENGTLNWSILLGRQKHSKTYLYAKVCNLIRLLSLSLSIKFTCSVNVNENNFLEKKNVVADIKLNATEYFM